LGAIAALLTAAGALFAAARRLVKGEAEKAAAKAGAQKPAAG
jgi:hypothetical protein